MNILYRLICVRNGLILVSLFLVINSVSCSRQFVGRQVNTNTQYWCQIIALPSTCVQNDEWFVWEYTIDKGQGENKFILKGTADPSQGGAKSLNVILLHESKFSLLLANRGTVVDNIGFRLIGDSIDSLISFERKFECEMPFDAGLIYWEATVRG